MKGSGDIIDAFAFARDMKPELRARLHAGLSEVSIPAGADILHPGDAVNGVYLVRSGAIRVYYIGPEGREGTLYWIEPGESCILALNSLFTEIPYPAWAAAEENGAEIITVSGPVFRALFAQEPAVQRFLFEQLSGRVFSLLQTLESAMRLPQEERLVLLLLALADGDGVVHLSQDKLARHLGTIREVVSRLLRNLASQGMIALAPRKVTILDRDCLETMVGDNG
ncbi:MAG: Crp/Fnr family transcriptional regulator [Tepidamorphaceae bacterium]